MRLLITSTHAGAFTLIEIMISSALMAIILVSAYLCLGAGISARKLVEPRAGIIQNARVAMALMTADLRAACPLSKSDDLLGLARTVNGIEADNLDFATHNYTPRHAREGDFCQESFYLDQNHDSGQFSLWRRRNPTIALDPLNGGSREEIAQGVVGLKFEYYDGQDWYNSWGNADSKQKAKTTTATQNNLTGLPQAIRITLLLDSDPAKRNLNAANTQPAPNDPPAPPFVFQTVVRLNLAAVQNSAITGATPTSDDAASSASPANGGNN